MADLKSFQAELDRPLRIATKFTNCTGAFLAQHQLEDVNLTVVRKRAGEEPRSSLDEYFNIPDVQVNEFMRFCSQCGEMVLKDDNFCEICGFQLESD